ncbi:MAG: hypothetical protein EZS28_014861 [Streblomastix strix]|uniref:Uncharacterized protein n=1 Tax=Streblomastix strix TaxID=222440 RepID=A0A5J4W4G1_9EUKA|nr:MAG: hypothetical protein EZS28_014861 [Streblomastix strix]
MVPYQVTPASDSISQESIVTGNAGISNEYSRSNHKHPLQVSTVLPAKDTVTGDESTANTYVRSDHTHHVNLINEVPKKDTGTGPADTSNINSSDTYQHLLNIDPTTANVPQVNATAAANATDVLLANGDSKPISDIASDGFVAKNRENIINRIRIFTLWRITRQ